MVDKVHECRSGTTGTTKAFTTAFWLVFAAGTGAFGWLLWTWGPRTGVLQTLDVELPLPSQWLISAAEAMRMPMGMMVAAGGFVALSLPFLLGVKGRAGVKLYGALALFALIAIAAVWWFLVRPIGMVAMELAPVPFPR